MKFTAMGLIFGFVTVTLILWLFMGCAGNVSEKPPVINQMETLDKNRVMELAKKINSDAISSMGLPPQITTSENMEEILFADDRKIAIVTFKISFMNSDNNNLNGELSISYIMVKDKSNTWSLSHVIARNLKEKTI